MLAVAIGAVSIGAWYEAIFLLFLFSASGAMEAFALDRTHRAVDALLQSAPKRALRLDESGREIEVAVETLCVGDRVAVKPGSAYPADGDVESGSSASDESTLTGESVPVEKSQGDSVFSGTINLWGAVDVIRCSACRRRAPCRRSSGSSRPRQKLRAPSERFTDKFGPRYTLCWCWGCASAMFLIWWLGVGLQPFVNVGDETSAFYRAMTPAGGDESLRVGALDSFRHSSGDSLGGTPRDSISRGRRH